MSDMTIEPQMGLTFEQVWAALMESRMEARKESMETERLLKESNAAFDKRMQENERLLKESSAEFDRRMRKSEKDFNQESAIWTTASANSQSI
ncbi:MAG: hypothetical protein LBG05_09865 [Treponema sp.]|jgi:hypothetical protein|nr:hypothetical protein [Treponema sp.]